MGLRVVTAISNGSVCQHDALSEHLCQADV